MINEAYERTIAPVADWVRQTRDNGMYFLEPPFESGQASRSRLRDRDVIMLSTSNYLGLAEHPEIAGAMKDALDQFGPSTCGARLSNGTTKLHHELEERLSQWLGAEAVALFSSGYLANLGAISAMCDSETVIITDQFNHMSILDGCRLAEGSVKIFAHNSIEKLEYVLERNADAAKKFIVVDGVYSLDGEIAPLDGISKLAEQHGAMLMVDEAHAVGVLGDGGRGAAAHFGIGSDVLMGTFSKSLAGVGGFVAGSTRLIEYIRHTSHAYIFNASLPAPTVAGVLKSLELMRRESWRIEKLWHNTARLRSGLLELGYEVMGSVTPVVPIMIGDDEVALKLANELIDDGLYVTVALPPAVPKNTSRFRANVSAAMDDETIDRALELLGQAGKRHGILS
ncbi:glycine C-acetyltransferase [Saccharopolyspora erythraea NRRL 2338]|uniref:8-amino-7-oxononanoate synthase n=2 Tax=Saccharopolyspora erythraea TaxID=1836 RepID=A4FI71_SACEN|nr:pyridoxal phosphate-dependent aminotransferase family protein [Saccharopolyspora erythraea]EQD83219.1 8-amino-7-oxononanoate synthase [Saccharopolyspora erythraea D]PFG97426.1 glycine C-acetyltransferase [Saccharopolyspora erythraea NRRL 2338]QRK87606.1 pyridoxal phosphate-dependent aminotransferase family protein [Saccharopolyspora erythraea]CAM03746.1 8-amino-7-oxononanoate synthase [Saccharopolyspora erythraea NRRL 2338]